MVYIHGGAFLTGNASRHDPKLFMDQDIVVVIIQYRLGVLGGWRFLPLYFVTRVPFWKSN